MTRFFSLILAVFCLFSVMERAEAQAQNTVFFGFGRANVYDTYLSPIEYAGPEMNVSVSTERHLKRNPHILFHTNSQIHAGWLHNPLKIAHEANGSLSHDFGYSYRWNNALPRLSLDAGLTVGAAIGGTYNNQNGNNPAQGRASMRRSIVGQARYVLPVKKHRLELTYRARLPFFGAMFSPGYGQSYYNIFAQGNWDGNILATHPGNALSFHHRFTIGLPLVRRTWVIGYESLLEQAKPNNLRQHHYSRSFVIGWTLGRTPKHAKP
ncbi:MAG: DUF3316 domain-containing protein [Bacteroidaceae bacterium]|nr:DUF3316 domain-containing protein [Bacteroidaceae bacterium]